MGVITVFIQKAIGQGVCILFGANGEILTEKSGNLNLGVPGMMYMGGIAGLAAAFMYERAVAVPNAIVGFILALLAAHRGRVLARSRILDAVQSGDKFTTERTIDVQIANLRRKLGRWAEHIETIRGVGYRVKP